MTTAMSMTATDTTTITKAIKKAGGLVFASLLFASCTPISYLDSTRTYSFQNTKSILINLPALVQLSKGPRNGLMITGTETNLKHISCRQDGTELKILLTVPQLNIEKPLKIEIELSDLEKIKIEGQTNLVLPPASYSIPMNITIRDWSSLSIYNCEFAELAIDAWDQAQVNGSGKSDLLTLRAWGKAQLNLATMQSEIAALDARQKSKIQILQPRKIVKKKSPLAEILVQN